MNTRLQKIHDCITPFLEENGHRLAFVEPVKGGFHLALEDALGNGATLGACGKLHRSLRVLLEQNQLLSEKNTLEVGSPGLDRPLFTPSDYDRFQGKTISLTLREPMDGQKRFEGTLLEHTDGRILMQEEGTPPVSIALDDVRHCKLVPFS